MIRDIGNGFYSWSGNMYHSDIVRSAIRPYVKAIGKLVGKHIRESILPDGGKQIKTNPDAYIRFLLSEPNPFMTGQIMQEKLAAQLILNRNAFALVISDDNGYPTQIYPIPCASVETKYDKAGQLYLKFYYLNGKSNTFPYSAVIHLRRDYFDNDLFGSPITPVLAPLMEVVTTTDQGIVKAIKNSAVIQWLLKYAVAMKDEDLKKNAKRFTDNYLSIASESIGVAATDSKAEAIQIKPTDYVPNAAQMDRTTKRIYSLLGTNDKIVQSDYTEDQWTAYYEAEIEPDVIQMSEVWSLRLFTRHQRAFGNRILFESANLAFATLTTKLALVAMVDRGAMTPNEWRAVFNLSPIDGGDEPIRRLDTRPTSEDGNGNGDTK